MKLPVPYYSQFIDIQDPFWMLRACGATSLKMVAEFEGVKELDLLALCNESKASGGYDMENGWIHDYLVSKAKSYGLDAYRKEGLADVKEIIASLDAGHPVIVSVEKRVLEQKRFHMLVIVGYNKTQTLQTDADLADNTISTVSESTISYSLPAIDYLYYHEPESTNRDRGQFRKVNLATFMNYWRGKAIFIQK